MTVIVAKRTVSGVWGCQTGDGKEYAIDKTWDVREAERRAYLSITESTEPLVEYHTLAYPPCTSFRAVDLVVENHRLTRELSGDDKLLYGFLDIFRWCRRI